MINHYDAIVIGTGQAGPSLAARLAAEGMKTAIIERKNFGGTCVNNGCIPTKALVASARSAYMARRSWEYGVKIQGSISVDMKKVKARKDALVKASTEGVENWLKSTENLTVFEGHARFTGPKAVKVGEEELEADKIFINVGGRPFVPPGFEDVPYLTNSDMMEIDYIPEHLIVVGGSYIGLEFGQMYRRFGSRVTIIEQGQHLIGREDEDISQSVAKILENEAIELRLNAKCINAKKEGTQILVEVDCKSGDRQVIGSHMLLAVGRRPNTHDLGLEAAGIVTDKKGFIVVNDQLGTNIEGVWALGDCNGRGAFTHTAYNDYEIVAANLFEKDSRKVSDRILCYGLFIDPALGRVGMTGDQARQYAKDTGKKVLIGTRSMKRIGRAKEKGETQGFMKILVEAESKQILGAAILGIEGDEVIHSILDVMYAKKPYTLIQRAVHIHPTVSELIPTMLGELKPLTQAGKAKHKPPK